MSLGSSEGVEGKDEAENLRADVNMDVELSEVPEGREVIKEPRSLAVQRPERTDRMSVDITNHRPRRKREVSSSPAEVVQMYVFFSGQYSSVRPNFIS